MLHVLWVLFTLCATPNLAHAAIQTFDYILVGGGTNGLVVANRVSEDPKITVVVIEADDSVFDDAAVKDTNGYGKTPSSIDWQFQTTSQELGDKKTHILRAGKAIGGISTINGIQPA